MPDLLGGLSAQIAKKVHVNLIMDKIAKGVSSIVAGESPFPKKPDRWEQLAARLSVKKSKSPTSKGESRDAASAY